MSDPKYDIEKTIAEKTKQFFDGFYSAFSMELLSSVDYVVNYKGITDSEQVSQEIMKWNTRKSNLFGNER